MEIFKITRQGQGNGVAVQGVSSEKPLVEQQDQISEAAELKQAKALAGEVVQGQVVDSDTSGPVESTEPGFTLDASQKDKVIVKIDGPLSQVFTEALNKVLAFENMVLLPVLAEEYDAMKDDPSFNDTTSIHVQAYDAHDLTTGDVVDITNEITKTTEDSHIIAMESARGMSTATGSAEAVYRSLKVASYYRFTSAANKIVSIAKNHGV